MKRHVLAALAIAPTLAFTVSAAHAQCAFPHPGKAKTFQSGLVSAFVSCGNPGGNVPNDTTQGGVPSCSPPETFNEQAGSPPNGWLWNIGKGFGTVRLRPTNNKVISILNPPGDTKDIAIKMTLRGVVDAAGPASGPGTLATVARATFDDRANGDMTVIDFPAPFPFTLSNGSASLKTSANVLLNGIGQPGLPPCANIEVVSIGVFDENGNQFANLGSFIPE